MATSCDGRPDSLNPRGSGYYAVVVIELSSRSVLYQTYNLRTVRACKEQLLNRYTSATAEAWPIDALVVAPVAPPPTALGAIPEGMSKRDSGVWMSRRNGVWLTTDDEVAYHADRAEDEDPPEESEVPSEPTSWLCGQDLPVGAHDHLWP